MPSATASGTRKLSDVARHVVVPEGIVSTGYPAVQAKCRDLGIEHDDWQQALGRLILGKRANGKYAATVGGVVMSIPRQVGKTFTVGSIIFALCILFPRLTVLWTAHRSRTSDETFMAMVSMQERRKIKPHMLKERAANGQQEIRFRNGSRIMFGAREHGFGRGFAQVDIEVFDEAQILTERALDDMVPATNQARHPAGALLFYMGTPPRPVDPSDVFRSKRARALEGKTRDQVYVELSADPDADPDDEEQWQRANPSYPLRTPRESMMRMRENTGSDEAYLREALGVWDEVTAGSSDGIAPPSWLALVDPTPIPRGCTLAVSADPDHQYAAIAAGFRRPDGRPHVVLLAWRPTVGWLKAELSRLRAQFGARVVVDTTLRGLVAGEEMSPAQVAQAHNRLASLVETAEMSHDGNGPLDVAVGASRWRAYGDTRVLVRRGSTDVTPLLAAALALPVRRPAALPLTDGAPTDAPAFPGAAAGETAFLTTAQF